MACTQKVRNLDKYGEKKKKKCSFIYQHATELRQKSMKNL